MASAAESGALVCLLPARALKDCGREAERSLGTERTHYQRNRHARPTTLDLGNRDPDARTADVMDNGAGSGERLARHFQAGWLDSCGTLVGALSEPHALLAFRATFSVRGAERWVALATALVKARS